MKTCTKCKIEKEAVDFHKDFKRKDGLQPWCAACISATNKINYQKNIEARRQIKKSYNMNNRQRLAEYEREYYKINHGKGPAKTALYKATKLMATPSWANLDAINKIYENCPKGYEVDHIVPLRGKLVSGLHVEYNLQYLTVSENRAKNNKFQGVK